MKRLALVPALALLTACGGDPFTLADLAIDPGASDTGEAGDAGERPSLDAAPTHEQHDAARDSLDASADGLNASDAASDAGDASDPFDAAPDAPAPPLDANTCTPVPSGSVPCGQYVCPSNHEACETSGGQAGCILTWSCNACLETYTCACLMAYSHATSCVEVGPGEFELSD